MENNYITPGKYIVAVSGGVDSVVLLDLLTKEKELDLIVAHVDHGIRDDSASDRILVEKLSKKYNLAFESTDLHLGKEASEDLARQKRYEFLHKIKNKYKATAIITAHHMDDVLETAFINLVRGTGFRGLASLTSTNELLRPLLNLNKKQIIQYANRHNLKWQEDSTNQDTRYLRNKIRHRIIAKMNQQQRLRLQQIIEKQLLLNNQIDREVRNLIHKGLHKGQPILGRSWFNSLPHDISSEIIRKFLLDSGASEIDKNTIDRVVVAIKTLQAGKIVQAPGVNIILTKRSARAKSNSKTDKKQV